MVRHVSPKAATTVEPKDSIIVGNKDVLNSKLNQQLDVIASMEDYVVKNVEPFLLDVEKSWQANDLLPDPSSESFLEEIKEVRERAKDLPDDLLVALSGDMITEEALPTYMSMLNTLEGVRDQSGASDTPWARWTRAWTAEENRHGDAMNKYMWLTGKVDLRAIEKTIQYLITKGMDPKTENNPYYGFIYTSFQERATKVSHGNTARLAKQKGDINLAKLCGLVAADESRHMYAYCAIVQEFFNRDPSGTMLAFQTMMKKQIAMPAHFMDDGSHKDFNKGRSLFTDYSAVAENLGVYTAKDYADITQWLIKQWDVNSITGLTPEALEAQQFVCKLPDRIIKLAARTDARKKRNAKEVRAKFSWVFNKELIL